MKVLIIGNLGYIGPVVTKFLREKYSDAIISGFDIGYFSHVLSTLGYSPDILLNKQYFGDVRKFPDEILNNYEIVIYLAAISNDPMGKLFEKPTYKINQEFAVNIAKSAKHAGVKKFIFASSCSVYGTTDDKPRSENSTLNPLTAYAKSKVETEKELKPIASDEFIVTCLRFATACGFSPRLRLDLVLNDFVASALANGKINVLSDGSPWRPLIDVRDMASAINWSLNRNALNGGNFLAVNVGRGDCNYQVRDIAYLVSEICDGVDVSINTNANPDNRSYKVNFDLFQALAPPDTLTHSLISTVKKLKDGLDKISFTDENFRTNHWMRLKILEEHRKKGVLDKNLRWRAKK